VSPTNLQSPHSHAKEMCATPTRPDVLAIDGGSPVRNTATAVCRQSIDEDDIRAVVATLRSDWLTTGPKVDEFEQAFAHQVSAKYAVSFKFRHGGLHGAAFAAGLKPEMRAITYR